MFQEIKNMLDVIAFLHHLTSELGDRNPFEEFGNPTIYTPEKNERRRKQMEQCFEVVKMQSSNFIWLTIVLLEEAQDNPTHNQFTLKIYNND